MDEYFNIEKYIVASDIGSGRDGMGWDGMGWDGISIEVYSGDDRILEVFRDHTKRPER